MRRRAPHRAEQGQDRADAPAGPIGGINEHITPPGERGPGGDRPGQASIGAVSGIQPQRQQVPGPAGHNRMGPVGSFRG
jgi:hypothetical protein